MFNPSDGIFFVHIIVKTLIWNFFSLDLTDIEGILQQFISDIEIWG